MTQDSTTQQTRSPADEEPEGAHGAGNASPSPACPAARPSARPAGARPAAAGSEGPLVSVIIPVYNVAPYLRSCVESILTQTHANLQVVLVDDGSTDGSGPLCDQLAAADPRVEVIHQANDGVSSARNAGVDLSRGAYLAFADSDDLVMPDWIEYLLSGITRYGAQVASCDFYVDDSSWAEPMGPRAGDPAPAGFHEAHGNGLLVLDRRDATSLLVQDTILQNYLWDKLWDAQLWDGVRFPKGHVFEDVSTAYRVLQRIDRLAMLPQAKYLYISRTTSIVRCRSIGNELDGVRAHQRRYRDLADEYPELAPTMRDGIAKSMVAVWQLAWQERARLTPAMRAELRAQAAFLRKYPPSRELAASLGATGRLTLPLLRRANALSWLAAHTLHRVYVRFHPEWAGLDEKTAGAPGREAVPAPGMPTPAAPAADTPLASDLGEDRR